MRGSVLRSHLEFALETLVEIYVLEDDKSLNHKIYTELRGKIKTAISKIWGELLNFLRIFHKFSTKIMVESNFLEISRVF